MVRENFFILLDIPFDPPPTDPAEIRAAIQNKHREWASMSNDPKTQSTALHYMELIPEMEHVLLDPELRQEEVIKAKEIRQKVLAPFEAEIQLLEAKKYLHPREVTALVQKYGAYGIRSDMVKQRIHVPITDIPPKKVERKQQIPALDYNTVQEIKKHLDVLGETNLYSFLKLEAGSSVTALLSEAQKIQHQAFHTPGKNGQIIATQQLAGLAIAIFETQQTKAAYDAYLAVSNYLELNDLIMQEYERSGFISPEMLIRLVNFGVNTYGTRILELEEYIRAYCYAYNIPVDMEEQQIVCPNCAELSARGSTYCKHCAAPLEDNCPNCGSFFTGGVEACSTCGFTVGMMGKALPYLEKAEAALIENNWSAAQHAIAYIEQYWPNHPELPRLKEQAHDIEQHYNELIKAVETAIHNNQYYAAKEMADNAANRHVMLPSHLLDMIYGTLANFEKQIEQLKQVGNIDYDSLNTLSAYVADSMELGRMLSKYPPEPPTRLSARASGESVNVSWGKSPTMGNIEYVVVRKEGSVPLTAYDGDVLYQGAEHGFLDETIPPLKNYFYSVFSKRGATYSEMGAVGALPVRIVPELQNFKITPADSAVQLTWGPPEYLREVQIWRKKGEDRPKSVEECEQLRTQRLDGFTDKELKNGEVYWYCVRAVYITPDDELLESHGLCEHVTPHKLVSPIDHFSILSVENIPNTYEVNWQDGPRDEVIFFHSQTKPKYHLGQMVLIEDMLREFSRLPLENQTSTSAQFPLNFSGGCYVFPVVISDQFGAVGRYYYLTNIPNVRNINYEIAGSELFFNFRWPSSIFQSVILAWRKDSFPTSPTQKGTSTFICTREEYDTHAGIIIPNITAGRYYFKIYTVFEPLEQDTLFSAGEELLIDNTPAREVFYSIKYKESLFSSLPTTIITVQCEEVFELPRALLVGKVGRIPLTITDGMPLFEVEKAQSVAGAITFEYKSEKLPKNMYIRLFFFDEHVYQRLRPLPTDSLKLT